MKDNMISKICRCRHPLSEHEAGLGCGVPNPEWGKDMNDYCRHCEEDATWQQ